MYLNSSKIVAVSVSLLAFSCAAWAADLVVVVNPDSPLTALSREQVTSLFLGKASSMPGYCCPTLLDQPESSPLREAFYNAVTGRSAAQAKSSWAKLYFTGKGIPPKEGHNSEEIRKLVAGNKNMLGYIEKSMADSSVKIVFAAP